MERELFINGRTVPLVLRKSSRAKRFLLRFNPQGTALVATSPATVASKHLLDFVERNRPWIAKKLEEFRCVLDLREGDFLPLYGEPHRIVRTGQMRGHIEVASGEIFVPGDLPHMKRRLVDFCKQEAVARCRTLSTEKTDRLGVLWRTVSVREMRSRWGVCSARGDLTYNWRLILAPAFVLDYVVVHEVCHLLEQNHGRRFWEHVRELLPTFRVAHTWLKNNGNSLYRYGI